MAMRRELYASSDTKTRKPHVRNQNNSLKIKFMSQKKRNDRKRCHKLDEASSPTLMSSESLSISTPQTLFSARISTHTHTHQFLLYNVSARFQMRIWHTRNKLQNAKQTTALYSKLLFPGTTHRLNFHLK